VVGAANPFDAVDPPQSAKGGNFFDDPPAANGGYGRDPVVGVPTDEQPADNTPLVPGYANGSTSANLRMLGQAGEDARRNIIAGVPFGEKAGALINSYVNGSS
jgi:hypothetical protein